jgi:hypothetical protein
MKRMHLASVSVLLTHFVAHRHLTTSHRLTHYLTCIQVILAIIILRVYNVVFRLPFAGHPEVAQLKTGPRRAALQGGHPR